jgi:hypothetical protein
MKLSNDSHLCNQLRKQSCDHICAGSSEILHFLVLAGFIFHTVTVPDQFPIPCQSDILQALSGAQYLSTFDVLAGFTQLEFDDVSQPYTTMQTHHGLHQFMRIGYFNTCLAMSTSHHPQTDGQMEVMNQHLKTMIQCYVNADHNDWVDWLDILASAYNRASHLSTLTSPSALLMGFTPRTPLCLLQESAGLVTTDSPLADNCVSALHVQRDLAHDAIVHAMELQAYPYNKKQRVVLYKVGDKVLLNPHSLELVNVKGTGRKLMQ